MFFKYTSKLFENFKNYDKKATNPFLKSKKNLKFDNSKTLYEKTYIWIEENSK